MLRKILILTVVMFLFFVQSVYAYNILDYLKNLFFHFAQPSIIGGYYTSCQRCGLLNPIINPSSPNAGSGFEIECLTTDSSGACRGVSEPKWCNGVIAYTSYNGYTGCPFAGWTDQGAKFNCLNHPSGTYTAYCKVNSNEQCWPTSNGLTCGEGPTSKSFIVQGTTSTTLPGSTSTTTQRSSTTTTSPSTSTTTQPSSCYYGTATATNPVNYGNYKIYAMSGVNDKSATIVIRDSSGNFLYTSNVNQGYIFNANSTGVTVKVLKVRALQDQTIIGVDLAVGPIGVQCQTITTTSSTSTTSSTTTTTQPGSTTTRPSTTTTQSICQRCGLESPVIIPYPIVSGKDFKIICPATDSSGACRGLAETKWCNGTIAYTSYNGYTGCQFSGWITQGARFDCPAHPSGTYTAYCKVNSNEQCWPESNGLTCGEGPTSSSFTVQNPTTTTTSSTATTLPGQSSTTSTTQPSTKISFGAFYYPWYGSSDDSWKHWNGPAKNGVVYNAPKTWYSRYLPDRENGQFDPSNDLYDSNQWDTVHWQLELMNRAGIQFVISSWNGIGDYSDIAFRRILLDYMKRPDNPYPSLLWTVYYEAEGFRDPSESDIKNDLNWIINNYCNDPNYFKIDGKCVIFVYGDPNDGPGYVTRWADVRNSLGNVFIVLKVFPGFENYASWVDGWHQYAPANRYEEHLPYSAFASPGFSQPDNPDPNVKELKRDVNEFRDAVAKLKASGARFKLIETWNEYHEGTQVEPAQPVKLNSNTGLYESAGKSYGTDFIDAVRLEKQQFSFISWLLSIFKIK
jgi:hypothetical protein